MYRSFCALIACVFLVSAQPSGEWVSLFNGVDLTNWVIKAHADDVDGGYVYVEDSAIVMDGHDNDHDYVWCYSEEEHIDFHLRLKFQGERGDYANSGIQVRSRYDHDDGPGWLNGPQIDIGFIDRNGSIWDETRNNQRWLYEDYSPKIFYWSDEGTGWNDLEVIVQDLQIVAIQNGDTITDYDGSGVLDDQNHIDLGVGTTGHIALQIHAGDIMKIKYKDIEIMDLGETAIDCRGNSICSVPAQSLSRVTIHQSNAGLQFSAPRGAYHTVTIYDITGRTVLSHHGEVNNLVLEGTRNLPAGLYVLRIHGASGQYVSRLALAD